MHQHLRPVKRTQSANPTDSTAAAATRVANETLTRRLSGQAAGSETSSPNPGSLSENAHSETSSITSNPETVRLNLIVQHFFTKAALIIVASRINLPRALTKDGDVRLDKWFNTWLPDTNALTQSLQEWRTLEVTEKRPEPLVIDIYLDTAQLPQGQSLVGHGAISKRISVSDILRRRVQHGLLSGQDATKLVYERWTISLRNAAISSTSITPDAPPNVYKKGVVLLRSLFTYARLLPGAKIARRTKQRNGSNTASVSGYRIDNGISSESRGDFLTWPVLSSTGPVTEKYSFAPLPCSFGALQISVEYRVNCEFSIDCSERFLSSQLGTGSLGYSSSLRASGSQSDEMGSDLRRPQSSRILSDDAASGDDIAKTVPTDFRSISAPRNIGGRPDPQATFAAPRRPSATFQPFKAGSLSSSPGAGFQLAGSPSSSLGRSGRPSFSAYSRERSAPTVTPQQITQDPSSSAEGSSTVAVVSPEPRSPKPGSIPRYSSSFGNRKARLPTTVGFNATTTDDDNNSSGKGSVSSALRVSTTLTDSEHAVARSQDDSESIGDFLKMLDKSSKGLTSFNKTDQASVDANSQRTAAQYNKFARMRDSTTQLSESISSSLMLQRSSGSLNRQYHGSSGLTGTSPSLSASPGKPISPHTPHIPAVPSRLSNNSVAEDSRGESHDRQQPLAATPGDGQEDEVIDAPVGSRVTSAIDIPNSPRTYAHSTSRRSSSVHPQARVSMTMQDDLLTFGMRSSSLPVDERPAYSADDDEPLLFAMGELGMSSQRRTD